MPSEEKRVDVEKMSRETGIPVKEIESVLAAESNIGITTIDQAKQAYFKTEKYSRKRKEILARMVELATTVHEFTELSRLGFIQEMQDARHYGESKVDPYSLAIKKWSELSAGQVEKASNAEEARKAYFDSPIQNRELRLEAFNKWLQLAETFEELQEAYKGALDENMKRMAINKLKVFFILE